MVAALAALAQETRLDIMRFLVRREPRGVPAGIIGHDLELPSATLAFHLNTLAGAALALHRRIGRQIIYRAAFSAMPGAVAYLLGQCCVEVEAASTAEDPA